MITRESVKVFEAGSGGGSVSVVIPLYNYQDYIEETLNTLLGQTLSDISILVIDDCSKDRSGEVVAAWMRQFSSRFRRCVLARHVSNAKLATTRNTGISLADTPYIFFLDADNLLYSTCLAQHLEALENTPGAMAAYSLIEIFDADRGIMGSQIFHRDHFKYGNHVDAMAMVRRAYLLEVGGYNNIQYGWEDYDLWLRMCDRGDYAIQIPSILSKYRVHKNSMLRTLTNVDNNHLKLRDNMQALYPWLELG